jgi:hypothetical protein
MNPGTIPRLHLLGMVAALVLVRAIHSDELLHLDFNDSANLGAQTGALPSATIHGDAKPSQAYPGSIDFGTQGGWVQVPRFISPRGSFSIEARFLIRNYGPENARFISDIMSTATWDAGPSQGFEMKVGGGYLYPTLPRNAYKTEAEWEAAQGGYSHIDRGRLSDCFAAFFMARKDVSQDWKAVYTDRCIEKNAWTHLVETWDGTNMRIYLNGSEATDKWRIQGLGAPPLIDSVIGAYAGAGFDAPLNKTYLDGILDYVKVEDGALSETEIHKRYQNTFDPRVRDSLCTGVIIPKYPEAGQVCKGKLDLEFKIINHGACTDTSFLPAVLAGDSVEVEIAKDPSFTDVVFHKVVTLAILQLAARDFAGLDGYQGVLYWRVRLAHRHSNALAKAAAADSEDWSLSRPLVMDMSDATAIRNPAHAQKAFHFRWQPGRFLIRGEDGSAPLIIDAAGKRQTAPVAP